MVVDRSAGPSRIIRPNCGNSRCMPTSENHPAADRHSIAIITLAEDMFRDMRHPLISTFLVTRASTEEQIKNLYR